MDKNATPRVVCPTCGLADWRTAFVKDGSSYLCEDYWHRVKELERELAAQSEEMTAKDRWMDDAASKAVKEIQRLEAALLHAHEEMEKLREDAERFRFVLLHTWISDGQRLHIAFEHEYGKELQGLALAIINRAMADALKESK